MQKRNLFLYVLYAWVAVVLLSLILLLSAKGQPAQSYDVHSDSSEMILGFPERGEPK